LCPTIVGPPRVRNHLSEGMQAAVVHHTEMAGELATLQVIVSSIVESELGRSPDENFWVEVVGELVAKFLRLEELCSWLEWPGVRIWDLVLGPPFGRARWADRLDEAAGWPEAELAAQSEVDAELEALCEFGT
jgi:hypothetical protein